MTQRDRGEILLAVKKGMFNEIMSELSSELREASHINIGGNSISAEGTASAKAQPRSPCSLP